MPDTYKLDTDVGRVRLEIDDTDVGGTVELHDAEIENWLEEEGTVLGAAVRACEMLARRYSRRYDITTDDQSLKRSQVAAAWTELAKDLRARLEREQGIDVIKTRRVDAYNLEEVDAEAVEGQGASGRVRAGYQDPDQHP